MRDDTGAANARSSEPSTGDRIQYWRQQCRRFIGRPPGAPEFTPDQITWYVNLAMRHRRDRLTALVERLQAMRTAANPVLAQHYDYPITWLRTVISNGTDSVHTAPVDRIPVSAEQAAFGAAVHEQQFRHDFRTAPCLVEATLHRGRGGNEPQAAYDDKIRECRTIVDLFEGELSGVSQDMYQRLIRTGAPPAGPEATST